MRRLSRQKELKKLLDDWMLQRFKNIIAHEMPEKRDHIVFCRLAAEQEEVYMRVLESPDYKKLLALEEPCDCGSGDPTNLCHPIDMNGALARWKHPDGDFCDPIGRCGHCIMFPALSNLQKIANHLELIKPVEGDDDSIFQRQSDFARMAFGDPTMDVRRDNNFFKQAHATGCGKMKALKVLLRTWKTGGSKVLLFSYSTQMLDILGDFATAEGYNHQRLDGSTSTSKRGKLVKDFNSNPNIFLFMLSTKAGGLGINLVSANKVPPSPSNFTGTACRTHSTPS